MIPYYPEFTELTIDMRKTLHPLFSRRKEGISEFTFANIYLFRYAHNYAISNLGDNLFVIAGSDGGEKFFILPFGLPDKELLEGLFGRFQSMKCVCEKTAQTLASTGYKIMEDRDNFDYLYSREEMAKLTGRRFHKKKNLVNAFISRYSYEGRPLLLEHVPDALKVLDVWRKEAGESGDYAAAKEALEKMEALQLCGGIYYVEGIPAAYTLGEELGGDTFVVHFEKGISGYKGLMQFVSQAFASILPEKYTRINREQDLGIEGLRKTKMSLRPAGFLKKYRVERG